MTQTYAKRFARSLTIGRHTDEALTVEKLSIGPLFALSLNASLARIAASRWRYIQWMRLKRASYRGVP